MQSRPRYSGIDHIGIAVEDLDAAEHTYRDVLGFRMLSRVDVEERGLRVSMLVAGAAHIELLAATQQDSQISGFLQQRGEGLHHVCVRVDDLDAAIEHIVARGGRIAGNKSSVGADGRRVAFVHPKSAHGLLLELVECPADASDA